MLEQNGPVKVVFLAGLGGEFGEVRVREHAAQIDPAMIAPQHQRDVMQDSLLDRIGLDAGMIVPVHVAMQLEPQKVHLDQHVQAGAIDNVIRAEGAPPSSIRLLVRWHH